MRRDFSKGGLTVLSYARGPGAALLECTIGQQLEIVANRFPENPAVISCHQTQRLTWSELLCAANSVAGELRKLGIAEGERVGIWATNCIEWPVVHIACARAGCVLVNVNPACRTHELAFILRESGIKALFLNEQDAKANYLDVLHEALAQGDTKLAHVVAFGTERWMEMSHSSASTGTGARPEDTTNIQYTSGTTGSPKGVLLTHSNLLNNGVLIARALRYNENDRICLPVPMAHCFGNVIGTMAALASGAALILPSAYFDAGATLKAIEEHRATAIYGVPTMFIAELQHPDFAQFDLHSLRTGVMAGAPCPVEVMKQVISDMHCPEMTIGYGLTETSPIVTMSDIDDGIERRVNTVGKVMPGTEVMIAAIGSGQTLEAGEQGEICARGYMLMKGYDGDPEATARVIDSEGWLHTGDLGLMREDGYLKVTGRAKDMIIRGGENIYPREVEEFLYTYPKIAEVQVTGLPDEKLGETVLAWIKLKESEPATSEEIQEFCKGKIAHFKIPQYVRFVTAFPTTLSGKIQKYRIRELEIKERRLEKATTIQTA
jgi:fatty-acyl-CoA synthase